MNTLRTKNDVLALPWKPVDSKAIPKRAACYRLVNRFTGKDDYIGETVNLRNRLFQSCHPVFKPGIHHIYAYFTDNENHRHYVEYRSIALLKPVENKRAGKIYSMDKKLVDSAYHEIFDSPLLMPSQKLSKP